MAFFKKRNTDVTTTIPLSRFSTPAQISSYIKKIIDASQYEFYQTEPMEVDEVFLNEPSNRGTVSGVLINSGKRLENVKPMFGNFTTVPLIAEQVSVIEFNEQHYYTAIVNRKNSINENSVPNVASGKNLGRKYGDNFERRKVKPIEIGEGCIVFEGRFGQVLHFDGHDNTPKIKISTHVDESDGNFRKENIDIDDSSIYLTSRGMMNNFDGEQIEGKKVLIQSDGIFIKGREEVRIKAIEELKINSPNLVVNGNETKLGSEDAEQSVIKGDDLVDFLSDMLTDINSAFNQAMSAITPGGVTATGGAPAIPIFAGQIVKLQSKLTTESRKFKSKKVKTI